MSGQINEADRPTRKGALQRINTLLAALGTLQATIALTAAAVAAAVAMLFVIAALGGPAVTATVICVATIVTVVVGAPIVFYSQLIIRKLRSSRSALKDVTSRLAIALDHAEQANRAKSSFLANMSHELRTPLNAIIGFSEMIRGQRLGPVGNGRYISYADDIHASGSHLLKIINDILDLSKIEAGQMTIDDAREFNLREAVDGSIRIVRPLAERARISLVVEQPQFAIRLLAVERMVQQIVINLLSNAVKFTPPGGIVRLQVTSKPGGSCTLAVRDTGVGMTKEEISRALLPFGQVENAMSRKHNGTGLGLPLSKAMMELHQGTLRIRSVPQQGTLVSLTFPAQRVATYQDTAMLHEAV
jgi:signal transduction histidine kinase